MTHYESLNHYEKSRWTGTAIKLGTDKSANYMISVSRNCRGKCEDGRGGGGGGGGGGEVELQPFAIT